MARRAVPCPTIRSRDDRVYGVLSSIVDALRGGGSVDQSAADGPSESDAIRVIRPVVVPAQFLVFGPILAGFVAVFPGFFTFIVSNALAGRFGPILGPALVVYTLAFVVILALLGLRAFYQPGLTTYSIYPDRIEFEEGLLNRQRRTVLLDRIIDVQLTEGVLQRTAGAGTVRLITQGFVGQGEGRLMNRTLFMWNVPDPGGVYGLVRSLAVGGRGIKSHLPE
jgi:membrane protein YdbS with pleckstrin-like domain